MNTGGDVSGFKRLFRRGVGRLREWLAAVRGRPALDALIAQASPDRPLAERVDWAEDFFAWVRQDVPVARLKLFLHLLERQPDARERVARTLRSLVRDTEALDLFADTGLPRGAAFMHELLGRIFSRVLPAAPDSRNLADIFDRLFPRDSDPQWLEGLEPEIAGRLLALFYEGESAGHPDWSGMRADLEDALVQLADRICVMGSDREVRGRLPQSPFRDLPFQKLPSAVELVLGKFRAGTPIAGLAAELNHVRILIEGCDRALDEVVKQLEKTGVNTALVYDLARLEAQLRRLELLLETWATPEQSVTRTLTLVADLIRQNHARRSVAALFRQNLHLLTRRIVERNAETGEHYVARNLREYLEMLRSAAGGGALTGFTTLAKLLLAKLALADFFKGAFFGLNYAVSFVAIQLCGFTLATKQPATTAPALARRMEGLRNAGQLEALVDEVVFLIRSQIAAVFGNLALVIPATLLLDLAYTTLTGHHAVDEHKAAVILQSVSPMSGAWLFAIFTGGLLWASSLFAAWMDNWFALHQLEPALAQHRRLHRWLGPTRTRRLAHWLGHNVTGLAGNISLGFMLGLAPEIAGFFGLPLDVRHVTLSTGQVTAAFAALGPESVLQMTTLGTVAGILGIGVLNVTVSFGLAMFVAIRARDVRGPEREQFFRALAKRLLLRPWSFILPIGPAVEEIGSEK
jgi:site-specific recombinase